LAGFPSQSEKPALHEAIVHIPPVQAGVAFGGIHTVPHPPQLLVVLRLVSHPLAGFIPQSAKPALHEAIVHIPPVQAGVVFGGGIHAVPHAPQLLTSFEVLTHAVPQRVSPAGQVQVPLTHASPIRHTCAHIPQLFGSFEVLTHVMPHRVPPIAQGVVVVVVEVVVVVVAGGATGAQSSFGVLGVTDRLPN
jgi:hypothetical protein